MVVKDVSDEDQKFNFKIVKDTEFFQIDSETGLVTIKKAFPVRFPTKNLNIAIFCLRKKKRTKYR